MVAVMMRVASLGKRRRHAVVSAGRQRGEFEVGYAEGRAAELGKRSGPWSCPGSGLPAGHLLTDEARPEISSAFQGGRLQAKGWCRKSLTGNAF
jgi:hypothetical protein